MLASFRLFKEEKHYSRIFFAGIINGIGDRFSQVALLALLLKTTGSGLAVGITLAIRVLPFLICGPLGGYLADHISRKKILIFTDLTRIIFALSFICVQNESDLWIIYLSSFFLGAGEAIYAPTRKSFISLMVKRENIIKVNGLEQVMLGFVLIGGSLSGGVISYFFGPTITFLLNGVSFLIAALILLPIPNVTTTLQTSKSGLVHSLKMIKSLIATSSVLLIAFLFELFVPIFNGIDNVLISVYAVQEYHLGELGVGLFYGALGIGLMLSVFVSNRVQHHLLQLTLIVLIIEGFLVIALSKIPFALGAIILFMLISFASGIGNTCLDSLIMKETPTETQGLVFGILSTMSNTMIGISMFSAGILLEFMDNRLLGFVGGIGFVLTGISLFIAYLYFSKKDDSIKLNEN